MCQLAFWSNKNPAVMRLCFEASPYYKNKDLKHKKKWARQDYSEGVIQKAISTGNVAKEYFKESFYYNEQTNTIERR